MTVLTRVIIEVVSQGGTGTPICMLITKDWQLLRLTLTKPQSRSVVSRQTKAPTNGQVTVPPKPVKACSNRSNTVLYQWLLMQINGSSIRRVSLINVRSIGMRSTMLCFWWELTKSKTGRSRIVGGLNGEKKGIFG